MIPSRAWCCPTPRSVTASRLRGGKTQIYTSSTVCSHLAMPLRSICKHLEAQRWAAEQKLCAGSSQPAHRRSWGCSAQSDHCWSSYGTLRTFSTSGITAAAVHGHEVSAISIKHIECKHSTGTYSQSAWLSPLDITAPGFQKGNADSKHGCRRNKYLLVVPGNSCLLQGWARSVLPAPAPQPKEFPSLWASQGDFPLTRRAQHHIFIFKGNPFPRECFEEEA